MRRMEARGPEWVLVWFPVGRRCRSLTGLLPGLPQSPLTFLSGWWKKVRSDRSADRYRSALDGYYGSARVVETYAEGLRVDVRDAPNEKSGSTMVTTNFYYACKWFASSMQNLALCFFYCLITDEDSRNSHFEMKFICAFTIQQLLAKL